MKKTCIRAAAFLFLTLGSFSYGAEGSNKFLSIGALGGGGLGMMPAAAFGIPFALTSYGATVGFKPIPNLEIAASFKYSNAYVPGGSTPLIFGNTTQWMADVRFRMSPQFGFYIGPTLGTQTFTAVPVALPGAFTTTLNSGFVWGIVLGWDFRLAEMLSLGIESGYIVSNPVPIVFTLKFWI